MFVSHAQTRFLRSHHPDVDVPIDIIREEIEYDDSSRLAYESIPTAGNKLALLQSAEVDPIQRRGVLAFPQGSPGNGLSESLSVNLHE